MAVVSQRFVEFTACHFRSFAGKDFSFSVPKMPNIVAALLGKAAIDVIQDVAEIVKTKESFRSDESDTRGRELSQSNLPLYVQVLC